MSDALQSISRSARGALAAVAVTLALSTHGNGAAAESHPHEDSQVETRSVIFRRRNAFMEASARRSCDSYSSRAIERAR